MTTELGLPRGRALTRADLDTMPEDGHRYELIDGTLIVSPAPSRRHQHASLRLTLLLESQLPEALDLLYAPFDVVLGDGTVMQPDLVIAPAADFTDRDLPTAPLVAIEILSPSTRGIDLLLKKERLERAGCPHYWVIDPSTDPGAPSITCWTLTDRRYQQTTHSEGDQPATITEPFPVTIVPAELVAAR